MPIVTAHQPGMLCWAELSTPDAAAAKRFYGEIFGWSANDMPMPEGVYSMLQVQGHDAAALFQDKGEAAHWRCYIAVASADAAAKAVTAAGGTLVAPPFDVFDAGRMFMAKDTTGALFAVWEPRKHVGATWVNDTGGLCWAELMTHDTAAAEQFYGRVFGWTTQKQDIGGGSMYVVFLSGGKPAVGMFEMPPDMKNVPPNWQPVFGVSDCDGAAEKVKKLGGNVLAAPMDFSGVGRYAVVQDPQGAGLSVLKPSG